MSKHACCVIKKKDKILLVKAKGKNGQWHIPGGEIKEKEPIKTAAQRNAKEQLDIEVKIGKELASQEFSDGKNTHKFTWLEAEIEKGKPRISQKNTLEEYKYFSVREMAAIDLSTPVQAYLVTQL